MQAMRRAHSTGLCLDQSGGSELFVQTFCSQEHACDDP